MRGRSRQAGFSLPEILIGLALAGLLMQAMVPALSVSLMSWRTSVARTEAHQSARMALEAMERDLRYAAVIAWPPPGGVDSRVSIRTVGVDGKLVAIGFQRGLSSGQNRDTLYRTYAQGQPVPLTQNAVSELRFECPSPRLIRITLTLSDRQTGVADTATTAITCVNALE